MNRNSKNVVIIVAVIVVIAVVAAIVWHGGGNATPSGAVQNPLDQANGGSTAPLPVSETTKTGSSSQYQNAELGFSVKYPSEWEKEETNTGVQFIMPIDQSQVSTVAKLESDVTVSPGKCAFPPVTTVEDRGAINVGSLALNMISMSNSVQGRAYFNRMYSLQNGETCYLFAFSYIALSPDSKGLTGSNLTQAKNNNKAIMSTADAAFTNMVKTFALVSTPAGKDETQASPSK
ncbi:MAG: hypothetical protein ABSF56_02245 [Minisyncoccia bacterium]|jgi:hypothetical protein